MLRKKIFENPNNYNKRIKTDETATDLLDLSVDNCSPTDVSKYFPHLQRNEVKTSIECKLLQLQMELNEKLRVINFLIPPIEYVYNPLDYAFGPNEMYVRKYCTTTKKILFVGMNPGPFGMCQTGVPFGDPKGFSETAIRLTRSSAVVFCLFLSCVFKKRQNTTADDRVNRITVSEKPSKWVHDWLKVDGEIKKPEIECPERKILGFSSKRKEQSGDRFWGLFQKICGTPECFFKHAFVSNFCPLAFMKRNGCNVTPGEIKNSQIRKELESVCDTWYLGLIRLLNPDVIVPVGEYMERRTKDLFKKHEINIQIIRMPHPSPRALNNQNWAEKAEIFLQNNNLMHYFQNQ